MLSSLKRDDGRSSVEHFYDEVEPLNATERRAVADAPNIDADLMREYWLGSTEGGGEKLAELITLPSLNIRGMASAHAGPQASNVIPSTATASIDVRLVLGMDPGRTLNSLWNTSASKASPSSPGSPPQRSAWVMRR